MILAHDSYFYWTHRLLHRPEPMRLLHRTHHLSRTPTPWAAYAFSPGEAVVQVAFAPLFAALVPLHPLILLIWSGHMIVRNVLGHAGFELMPAGFARSRWLAGSRRQRTMTCITRPSAGTTGCISPGGTG
jgi:Delta7-sterol 5-desaturase